MASRRERLVAKYGEEFMAFWWGFCHRKGCADLAGAYALWIGAKRCKDGSKITPDDYDDIREGSAAHSELMAAKDPEYWPNVEKWLYQMRWHRDIDELAELKEAQERASESSTDRRDYHAWKERAWAEGKVATVEEFEREKREGLRVVGGTG